MESAASLAAAEFEPIATRPYGRRLKRAVDFTLSLFALALLLPILVLIAVVIRLDSPGAAIFVQERVGLHGRPFRFYKFRSMCMNAESYMPTVRRLNEQEGPIFKIRQDPRVTRVGRLIRKTSLDELPQLFNVLRGDMSLVGPRPPLPSEVDQYRPADMIRLAVRPGLTCLWQIRGRSECDFETWMRYDREYVERMSLLLDIIILLRTVPAVLSCRGAY